ncbi:O-antigen ligase family protein [Terribacillus saccharophilus]|uniref:O-antigen ligase family protein n=1 Tax=Terribacillus saccharophilus TaxID=361277 RepID=UPI0015CF470C|nr:O-antigen ligase family protein [Terribacillus saccharophilus]
MALLPRLSLFGALLLIAVSVPFVISFNFYPIIIGAIAFIGLVSYLLISNKLTLDNFIVILLGFTTLPQSVAGGQLNVSISDLLLVVVILGLLLIKNADIEVPKFFFTISVLYILFSLFSMVNSENIGNSLIRLSQYTQYIIVTVIVFYNIKSSDIIKKTLFTYVVLASVVSVASIVIALKDGLIGTPLFVLGYQKNNLGAAVGYAIPLIIGLKQLQAKQKWLNIALLLNTACLLLSMSRGALLGSVFATLILLLLLKKYRTFFAALLAVGVGGLFLLKTLPENIIASVTNFSTDSSAYSRITIYQDAIRKIKDHIFFGNGVGDYMIKLPYINFQQDDPSNVFLLNLVELGIVGFVLFLILIITIFVTAIRNNKLFSDNRIFLLLNAICFSGFLARFIHIQADVTWVRGASMFMFAMVGMMFALRRIYFKMQKGR